MNAFADAVEIVLKLLAALAFMGWLFCLYVAVMVRRALAAMQRMPDFVIGSVDAPYMKRWWLIPRNRWFNTYLHHVLRSDDDRALHDHPWLNVSVVIAGGYWEVVPQWQPSAFEPVPPTERLWRGPGSIVVRWPSSAHRLEIEDGKPCWSLFITGPNVRDWGFWCPQGWKHWRRFVAADNAGEIGPGCGDDEVRS